MERTPRPEKVAIVEELKERFSSSSAVLLTEYRGLKVSELETLRKRLKPTGAEYKIFKNTFVRFAVQNGAVKDLVPLLQGPTGLTFVSGDAVEVAKALRDFAKDNPELVIKGGVLGEVIIAAKDILALADLPSRDVLLAKIAGGLAAPMQKFASLLQAVPQNFAYALSALVTERTSGEPASQGASQVTPEDVPAENSAEDGQDSQTSAVEAEEPHVEE